MQAEAYNGAGTVVNSGLTIRNRDILVFFTSPLQLNEYERDIPLEPEKL